RYSLFLPFTPSHLASTLPCPCPPNHRDLPSFPTRRSSDLKPGSSLPNDSIEAVCYPAGCAAAASFDPTLTRRMGAALGREARAADRKSTRLNSSHVSSSYAVFCLKKKNITHMWSYDRVMYC